MARPPHPALAERLFEKCTVINCSRSRRSAVCPACADIKPHGAPLCRQCLGDLTPALRAELQNSDIRFGYEQALYRALLERKARDFYMAEVERGGVLPMSPRKKLKEQSDG